MEIRLLDEECYAWTRKVEVEAYFQVFQEGLRGYGAPPRGAPMYGRVEPISWLSYHLQHSGLACVVLDIVSIKTTILSISAKRCLPFWA